MDITIYKRLVTKLLFETICLSLFLILNSCANSNKFVAQAIPEKYLARHMVSDNERFSTQKKFSNAVKIIDYLPAPVDSTGKTDYTSIIQKVLDSNSKIVFPDFPILVNSKGLTFRSNSEILFGKGSKITIANNSLDQYEILRLHNVRNITLYYPNVVGDRSQHISKTGEWGMGISIRAAQNINIEKPKVVDCWGDGIYLGYLNGNNKDIRINAPFLDNNRRNGMSIISADGLTVNHMLSVNTHGTPPNAGLDIEPDENIHVINNITLNYPVTINNEAGLLLVLSNLSGAIKHNVQIAINNAEDYSSNIGIGLLLFQDSSKGHCPVGKIRMNKLRLTNNKKPVSLWPNSDKNTIDITISDIQIFNGRNKEENFTWLSEEIATGSKITVR